MSLPLSTRVFGILEHATSRPVEQETDFPRRRSARLALQRSPVGQWLFGTSDRTVLTDVRTVDVDGRACRMIVHRPIDAQGAPIVLNLHGGGWVQGNPEQSAWFASRVAARAGVVVVSPDYRLAPEHPFPAAVDDTWALLQWVHAHAEELHGDADRIAVMGDSAGGGLAATVALQARDAGSPRIAAQVLIYPGVEAYDRWPSEDEFADAPVLTSANMRAFVRLYLGESYGTRDWRASPIRAASHAGVAPAFVVVADHDPLRDHGRRYAETLRRAGVPATLREYPGWHGFISLPGVHPAARDAVRDVADFLTTTFGRG
ncbi:MAG: alpha/beta hydrolase [Aeromicrobium erythreum]